MFPFRVPAESPVGTGRLQFRIHLVHLDTVERWIERPLLRLLL